jgi:hypothetical protein
MHARSTPSTSVLLIDVRRPFSNFDFVERQFTGSSPIRRLLSQARKASVQTLVLEELEHSSDLMEDNAGMERLEASFASGKVYRLSCFNQLLPDQIALAAAERNSFLGYAIIKEERLAGQTRYRVYESVFKTSRRQNNFVRGQQTWNCEIAGNSFAVSGHLYAQQNGLTTACAHVAVRTAAARFHPNGDMSYAEMDKILAADHSKARGGDGLIHADMEKLLRAAGAGVQITDFSVESPAPYQKYIYGSIESGYPAIVIFRASKSYHAVPIFGHTFNEDTWVPSASLSYFAVGQNTRYIPSDSWLSMFVGHDDNFGSNYCIPRHFLRTIHDVKDPDGPGVGIVEAVISTLPPEVKLNAIRAEVIGADFLLSLLRKFPEVNMPWSERLKKHFDDHRLVMRPILVKSGDYVRHLKLIRDWDGSSLPKGLTDAFGEMGETGYLWMIEISVPELFSANLRKIGEVLLRAESPASVERSLETFFLARLPGYFAFQSKSSSPDSPSYDFYESSMAGHVQLFGCEDERPQ